MSPLLLTACPSDDGAPSDGTTAAATSSSSTEDSGPPNSSSATPSSSGDTSSSTSSSTSALGESSSTSDASTSTGGEDLAPSYLSFVRGALAGDQAGHDGAIGEIQTELGDDLIAHEVFQGSGLIGTPSGDALWLDRTPTPTALDAVEDHDGRNTLLGDQFDPPPERLQFARGVDFYEWGDLDAADDTNPFYVVVIRGRFAADTLEAAREAHNAGAPALGETVMAIGDVAHVVYHGINDWADVLILDLWVTNKPIEGVYTDPDFGMALTQILEPDVTVQVFESTSWEQWD